VHPSVVAPRQSPLRTGGRRAALAALALSALVGVTAIVDAQAGRTLADHAATMYAPYHAEPHPGLLYGLLITIAVVQAVIWSAALAGARSGRWARALAATATVVTVGFAVLLLAATEYGRSIFPPVWGVLDLLPAAAGSVAVVLLRHRGR
jgi:hypothetical protein